MPPKKDARDKKAPAKAPKKPPTKPPAKPPTKPPAKAPKKPGGAETGKGSLAASPGLRKFALAVTLIATIAALVTIIFFVLELRSTGNLFKAVGDIRNFMIKENYASRTMDDPQILKEAKGLADVLYKWNEDNKVVGSHIQNIQGRIKAGWIPFNGHLYFFSTATDTFIIAKQDCENNDTITVNVESVEEETFLENIVKKSTIPHWLGIRRVRRDWTWETGENLARPNVYWLPGNPKPVTSNAQVCAVIVPCGQETLKCWKEVRCAEMYPWICKKKPDPKFNS